VGASTTRSVKQRLDDEDWVYIWVAGIYSGLRGEQQRLCALIVIGVTSQGEKRLLAIDDGVRESIQSWREVLLPFKARGLSAQTVAIGDGALGFWGAWRKSIPRPVTSAVGCTRPAMCSMPCQRVSSTRRNRRCARSGRQRLKPTLT